MLTIALILIGIFTVIYSCFVVVWVTVTIEDTVNNRKRKKLNEAFAYEYWLGRLGLMETRSIVENSRPKLSYFFNDLSDTLDGIFFGWM